MAESIVLIKNSEKILIWLHREDLTQVWLADKLKITRQAIANKISGNSFSDSDIVKIKSLGCPL